MSPDDPVARPAIALQGVGKRYVQLHEEAMLLRSLVPFRRAQRTELWALRGVDAVVGQGETVGVLGRNGAGKSTLLRLLAGVTQPTEGAVELRGRIAPLLSVGVGFHGEMSGRENVYFNGMLLGLDHQEVAERFDDIVAFAQLEGFIDTPVKFYSSGMFMRLGFSVAIHVDPQVLLIDEILAVGDLGFQVKCYDRLRALQARGTTILLVSHSMHAIRLLCPRAWVFRHGRLEHDGDTEDAIGLHHELLSTADDQSGLYLHDRIARNAVEVHDQELLNATGTPTRVVDPDGAELRARLHFREDVEAPQVLFVVRTEDGTVIYRRDSTVGRATVPYGAGDDAELRIPFESRFGGGGTLSLEVVVTDRDAGDVLGRSSTPTRCYAAPRLGTFGTTDIGAALLLDGTPIDLHEDLTLRAQPGPVDAPRE